MSTCLSKGDQVSRYLIDELLNDGAYALAYRAIDITDSERKVVFLKQYKSPSVRSGWYQGYISYEAEIRRRIEANGLTGKTCQFLDFFESRNAGQRAYYQVFEFVARGRDLQAQLENPVFRWDQRWTFSKLMLSTLNRLHEAGIVHCDLKPENLYLLEDPTISVGYQLKVIDFDHSLLADRQAPWVGFENYAGTPGYLSPEHLRGECPTTASDVFTAGLILYELLARGGHPYDVGDPDHYAEQALGFSAEAPIFLQSTGDSAFDASQAQLIRSCLDPNPANRPTMLQLHQALLQAGKGVHSVEPIAKMTSSPIRNLRKVGVDTPPPPPPPPPPPSSSGAPASAARFRVIEMLTPAEEAARVPKVKDPVVDLRLKDETGEAYHAPKDFSPEPAPMPAFSATVNENPDALRTLVLVAPSGQSAVLHIETSIGKSFLKRFGEDSKYYSELQFTIYPELDGWYVNPNAAAQNQSILNGTLLEGRQRLQSGDVLCVGNLRHNVTKLPLIVKIQS